jgi:hypothetical protein
MEELNKITNIYQSFLTTELDKVSTLSSEEQKTRYINAFNILEIVTSYLSEKYLDVQNRNLHDKLLDLRSIFRLVRIDNYFTEGYDNFDQFRLYRNQIIHKGIVGQEANGYLPEKTIRKLLYHLIIDFFTSEFYCDIDSSLYRFLQKNEKTLLGWLEALEFDTLKAKPIPEKLANIKSQTTHGPEHPHHQENEQEEVSQTTHGPQHPHHQENEQEEVSQTTHGPQHPHHQENEQEEVSQTTHGPQHPHHQENEQEEVSQTTHGPQHPHHQENEQEEVSQTTHGPQHPHHQENEQEDVSQSVTENSIELDGPDLLNPDDKPDSTAINEKRSKLKFWLILTAIAAIALFGIYYAYFPNINLLKPSKSLESLNGKRLPDLTKGIWIVNGKSTMNYKFYPEKLVLFNNGGYSKPKNFTYEITTKNGHNKLVLLEKDSIVFKWRITPTHVDELVLFNEESTIELILSRVKGPKTALNADQIPNLLSEKIIRVIQDFQDEIPVRNQINGVCYSKLLEALLVGQLKLELNLKSLEKLGFRKYKPGLFLNLASGEIVSQGDIFMRLDIGRAKDKLNIVNDMGYVQFTSPSRFLVEFKSKKDKGVTKSKKVYPLRFYQVTGLKSELFSDKSAYRFDERLKKGAYEVLVVNSESGQSSVIQISIQPKKTTSIIIDDSGKIHVTELNFAD